MEVAVVPVKKPVSFDCVVTVGLVQWRLFVSDLISVETST